MAEVLTTECQFHLLPINLAAVSNLQHDDGYVAIFNLADEAVVADPITPETCHLAHEGLAQPPRIRRREQFFVEKLENAPLRVFVEAFQLP